ncbi:aminotransferase class I/II-fold pyridoxal phosphate-dependent enzyme [Schnuerera sp. xch1]|uniref:aminotransferase class I/II-fold pyridoxal phosphate-dependent enzyme n=1 Tax=Schnuerera sp. xch1 TaxID=2874283 RepID=UPI001CBB85E6|nr:aminotransferase class I/II-fold pyridoxal phosphate-dependent enzyme [Schnuerera sp. xch1]MBZ2175051.1 aminotransferase class I/II-fold pyridoxal phosphate-dependent enzyme [Schnuerera sp. xch1]
MKTPIIDSLKILQRKNEISFHTPGHKGKDTLIEWTKYIPNIDTTELPGMDNLHNATGIIKESQQLAAKTFGALETIYSVNGTTGGIYIALAAITNPGDKILIQRDSHKSMYNASILNRLDIEYIYANYNEAHHMYTGVNPKSIELKLKEDPDIKVVAITYPNYYGICSDIKKIAEIVHNYDKILLVDEAHGSHFVFSDKLPLSSLEVHADITIQSTHKTLPSFTQTSMIHVGTHRVNIEKLKTMSSLYQTTSPSYLFMASLEAARAYMEGEGKGRLDRNIDIISYLTDTLQRIYGAYVFTGAEDDNTIYDKDITKILFGIKGITGTNLSRMLMEDYNIYLEMADFNYALALASLMNEKSDFEMLIKAVENIAKHGPNKSSSSINLHMPMSRIVLPVYEAFYSNKKAVALKESIGRVSSSFIIPYPPGIPLICPGEEITEELVDYITFSLSKGIDIIGLIGDNKEKIEIIE